MHLRMPSIDKGVQSFIWAVVFFCLCAYFVVRFAREEEAKELRREHSSQIA